MLLRSCRILRTTSDNIRPVSPGDSVLLRLLTEFLPTKLESHSAFAGASCVASTRSLSESCKKAKLGSRKIKQDCFTTRTGAGLEPAVSHFLFLTNCFHFFLLHFWGGSHPARNRTTYISSYSEESDPCTL